MFQVNQAKFKNNLPYLNALAREFPTQAETFTEIINLQAILNLPKGTEHFMSDLHGEYEAFEHILNNCSGVIREKVENRFPTLSPFEKNELLTLIYYPKEKLDLLEKQAPLEREWGRKTLKELVALAANLSSKYTRSKVRKAMSEVFRYVIDELLHAQDNEDINRSVYHEQILDTIWETNAFRPFVYSLTNLIKRLAVDQLHIVGDIYDRGPRPDKIMDKLMKHHTVDIQWGNHDVLWLGAAIGSVPCIVNVIRNNVRYNNWEVLENSYGISLRNFTIHAYANYKKDEKKNALERCINVLLFKAEGQAMLRHPEYNMADRLLFDKIDLKKSTVQLPDGEYKLNTSDFPTYNPYDPYTYTPDEQDIIDGWVRDFLNSDLLRRHMNFMISHGSLYKVLNNILMFHGGVPMNKEGEFRFINLRGETHRGRDYMDYVDRLVRTSFRRRNQDDLDFFWFLWINPDSPVSGRVIKTFERSYIDDESTWPEPQDNYYKLHRNKEVGEQVLAEFGIDPTIGHIINGHTPVKVAKGDVPVRADGKVICIDGGFCKAYQKSTGIAGYTLIYNSHGLRIKAHYPFKSIADVLANNADIDSVTTRVDVLPKRLMIADTDNGANLQEQIDGLNMLLIAYRDGIIQEHPEKSKMPMK